jgi:diadenosine tetraphosphatase ApaH/serine/threonine PP2A family protein phosphatase
LRIRYCASMEGYHLKLSLLIKLGRLIGRWRFLIKVQMLLIQGAFCDLMWSDPEDIEGWATNNRGAGWIFGAKVVRDFSYLNDIELVARAHQLVQ